MIEDVKKSIGCEKIVKYYALCSHKRPHKLLKPGMFGNALFCQDILMIIR